MSGNRDVLLYLKCGKCGYKTRLFATAEGKYFMHCGIPMFIMKIEVYKNGKQLYATEELYDGKKYKVEVSRAKQIYATEVMDDETNK